MWHNSCGYNAALQSQPLPAPCAARPGVLALPPRARRRPIATRDASRASGPESGDAAVFSRAFHTDVDAERIDAATLALVRDLTRVDELLFAEALSSFVARARRVENATGVALLCDLDDPPASGA